MLCSSKILNLKLRTQSIITSKTHNLHINYWKFEITLKNLKFKKINVVTKESYSSTTAMEIIQVEQLITVSVGLNWGTISTQWIFVDTGPVKDKESTFNHLTKSWKTFKVSKDKFCKNTIRLSKDLPNLHQCSSWPTVSDACKSWENFLISVQQSKLLEELKRKFIQWLFWIHFGNFTNQN